MATKPTATAKPAPKARPRIRKRDAEAALRRHHGLIGPAAADLGVTRQAVYNAMKRWPELDEARREARAFVVDVAEGSLYRKASAGEPWAVQFALRTLGRDRGYGDRLELQHGGRIDLTNLTDEELLALRDGAGRGDEPAPPG
jgi:hypothetical protein